ncbi:hypothetical protein M426DRAFT_23108 [Hypoxylon sp. CI-4A]|nr:hypothetical protein M426DRAFT_23108 [Hypoxylon sp. CI-4A]
MAAPGANPTTNSSTILDFFPAETILDILDHLPVEDKVCFGLTCTALHRFTYKIDKKRLDPQTKEAILIRLEKDHPGFFYCHSKEKLFPFGSTYLSGPLPLHVLTEQVKYFGVINFKGSTFKLRYYEARLATNHHLHGPEHGISPSTLTHRNPILRTSPESSPRNRRPKNLTFLPTGRPGSTQLFRTCNGKDLVGGSQDYLTKGEAFRVCMHAGVDVAAINCVKIPALDKGISRESGYHGTGSCIFCPTDWDCSVRWTGAKHGWAVTIKTYHEVGDCRSPYDTKWQQMTRATPFTIAKGRDIPHGSVRSQWLRK